MSEEELRKLLGPKFSEMSRKLPKNVNEPVEISERCRSLWIALKNREASGLYARLVIRETRTHTMGSNQPKLYHRHVSSQSPRSRPLVDPLPVARVRRGRRRRGLFHSPDLRPQKQQQNRGIRHDDYLERRRVHCGSAGERFFFWKVDDDGED